jgi:acid phosphatase (class A)
MKLILRPLAAAALAGGLVAAAPATSQTPRAFHYISAEEVQPALILAPPPADGTDAAAAELAELRQVARDATPEAWAQAKWDSDHEDGMMFQGAVAPGYDLARLPVTAKLLGEVRSEEGLAASIAKTYFKRTRPWIADGTLKTCSRDEDPHSSYPSGHATMAFAMATVLARAAPELGPQLLGRADRYARERMVCGMHYRSDIVAGQVLGVTVATLMLRDPGIQAQVAASRAELQAAHLLPAPI